MPDLTEAQRERLAEVRAQVDALVVAAIAEAQRERLAEVRAQTRAKWEAEDRYAALVDKVRALAELGVREQWPSDEWAAGLRTLLEADQ